MEVCGCVKFDVKINVVNRNESHMHKMEVVQNMVGKVALGVNAYVAVEAIGVAWVRVPSMRLARSVV